MSTKSAQPGWSPAGDSNAQHCPPFRREPVLDRLALPCAERMPKTCLPLVNGFSGPGVSKMLVVFMTDLCAREGESREPPCCRRVGRWCGPAYWPSTRYRRSSVYPGGDLLPPRTSTYSWHGLAASLLDADLVECLSRMRPTRRRRRRSAEARRVPARWWCRRQMCRWSEDGGCPTATSIVPWP